MLSSNLYQIQKLFIIIIIIIIIIMCCLIPRAYFVIGLWAVKLALN
jgi:hypothetical protein